MPFDVNRYMRTYMRERYRKTRAEILIRFGNKCCHCGFDDVRALQLDHKNGGGSQEKKRIRQDGIYKRALEHPEDYQLLCANCNWIKRHENREHRTRIID